MSTARRSPISSARCSAMQWDVRLFLSDILATQTTSGVAVTGSKRTRIAAAALGPGFLELQPSKNSTRCPTLEGAGRGCGVNPGVSS